MRLEQYLDENSQNISDPRKATYLRITSYDDGGQALRSWTIKLNNKIAKALIHLDLSHHDIQVLGYLQHGQIILESNKMQSSGMIDSFKNLERLDLVSSHDTNSGTSYKLTDKGIKVLREI